AVRMKRASGFSCRLHAAHSSPFGAMRLERKRHRHATPACLYCWLMAPDRHALHRPCPDRLARGPRACTEGKSPDRLHLAPPALQDAMLALVSRDTSRLALSDAQRLSHFPASPL